MKFSITLFTLITLFTGLNIAFTQNEKKDQKMSTNSVYDYTVLNIDEKPVPLEKYSGKVLLIVNVASKCGYTPQYEGLQNIYQKYKQDAFEILAFPCNDFGKQEPGSNEEIQNFCSTNYGVNFTLFDKIHVVGENKAPLYRWLTDNPVTGKDEIQWNFEKFLIDREGQIVKRFRSSVEPESEEMVTSIEALLK